MGRPDLPNQTILLQHCEETPSDDNLKETDPVKRKAELQQMHTYKSWAESLDCWICHRWHYCLPMLTQTVLNDSFLSDEQSSYCLTAGQARVLERYLAQEKQTIQTLKEKQAYIIGEATDFKLVKMDTLAQYMMKLDADARIVL